MEHPIKMDDLGISGYPYFWKHPYRDNKKPTEVSNSSISLCRKCVNEQKAKQQKNAPRYESCGGMPPCGHFGVAHFWIHTTPTCSGQISIIPKPECFGDFGWIPSLNHNLR